MEKFSVLMSVYYKEKPDFFDLALESNMVKQTLRPDEFILVCDGELTPELEVVIEKYRELFPNVLKVYRKKNGGLGKALNFGLQKCSYQLVARQIVMTYALLTDLKSRLNLWRSIQSMQFQVVQSQSLRRTLLRRYASRLIL